MKTLLCSVLLCLVIAVEQTAAQQPLAPQGSPNELIYVPFPVEITPDGVLDDWADVPEYVVDTALLQPSDATEVGSFRFQVAADERNLYVAITSQDDNIIAGAHDLDYWNEDSLEVYVNFSGDIDAMTYVDGIAQYIISPVALLEPDTDLPTYIGNRSDRLPIGVELFETDDGWGLEAQIPSAVPVRHGQGFGLQFQANGASEADRDVKLNWSAADTDDMSWNNPSLFAGAIYYEIGQTDVPDPSVLENPPPLTTFDPSQIGWEAMVEASWEGYKANYIFCGEPCGNDLGLVFDPAREYEAVSEAVGYGLLMAVMMDDQETFDVIYETAQEIMLNDLTSLYHWRVNNRGEIIGHFSATDAEQDTALALIFAEALVERGEWEQHADFPYGERADALLDALYVFAVDDGRYLTPSDAWEGTGKDLSNPSYFSPAWYRIYRDFNGDTRWGEVLSFGYRGLTLTDGQANGLAPDWATGEGRPAYDFCNTIDRRRDACTYDMSFEAIRTLWRVGVDCMWFDDMRACDWVQRSVDFMNSLPPSSFARLYDLQGNAIIDFNNELTVGMWLVAATAAEDEELQARLLEEMLVHSQNVLTDGYWGNTPEFYYNQSLAWFGVATYTGQFRNLYVDQPDG